MSSKGIWFVLGRMSMCYFTILTHPHPPTLNRFKVGLVKILLFFLFFVYFTLDFISFLLFLSSSFFSFFFSLKKMGKICYPRPSTWIPRSYGLSVCINGVWLYFREILKLQPTYHSLTHSVITTKKGVFQWIMMIASDHPSSLMYGNTHHHRESFRQKLNAPIDGIK